MKTEYEGWPAIETAPKDGTRILLLFYSEAINDHHVEIGRWYTSLRTLKAFWRLDRDDDSALTSLNVSMRPAPTNWAPIPYPTTVIGPVILPLSDEPEVQHVTTPNQNRGVRFHCYDIDDDQVIVAYTRKGLCKWVATQLRTGTPTEANITDTWTQVRAHNASGIDPWLFVGPYESDVHGECVLYVAMSRDDAKAQSDLMAEDI